MGDGVSENGGCAENLRRFRSKVPSRRQNGEALLVRLGLAPPYRRHVHEQDAISGENSSRGSPSRRLSQSRGRRKKASVDRAQRRRKKADSFLEPPTRNALEEAADLVPAPEIVERWRRGSVRTHWSVEVLERFREKTSTLLEERSRRHIQPADTSGTADEDRPVTPPVTSRKVPDPFRAPGGPTRSSCPAGVPPSIEDSASDPPQTPVDPLHVPTFPEVVRNAPPNIETSSDNSPLSTFFPNVTFRPDHRRDPTTRPDVTSPPIPSQTTRRVNT